MIDRPLLLVCTDKATHPECELVDLRPVNTPRTDLPPELRRQESAATHRGFGAQETMTRANPGSRKTWRKAPVTIVGSVAGETVHVPRCPRCGRAPRLRVDKLLVAARALRPDEDAPRDVVDVSLLPASIGN